MLRSLRLPRLGPYLCGVDVEEEAVLAADGLEGVVRVRLDAGGPGLAGVHHALQAHGARALMQNKTGI